MILSKFRKITTIFVFFIIGPFVRFFKYFRNKWKYGKLVSFKYSVNIDNNSLFEGNNLIASRSYYSGKMGFGSYIGRDGFIEANVGKYCSIGPRVFVSRDIHPTTYPYVSISPMFFSLRKQNGHTFAQYQGFEERKPYVEIGNDVWICQDVIIIGGVKIGDGAVVGAGAIVTKDVPPYAIVAGVPAKIIKYRYTEEDIAFLNKIKWWNKSTEWLAQHWDLFIDFDKLKLYFNRS